ncbi:hypothetical protein XENORESO_005317 [Xenotaenia resolanae]|uniref:Uncharacterized protein n=1 Tax=Xenotaenia resolanae TaxID=208358 RepID=A0ABV0VUZ4_9TELE
MDQQLPHYDKAQALTSHQLGQLPSHGLPCSTTKVLKVILQDAPGVIGAGLCVELQLYGCGFLGFLGMELTCGCVLLCCGEGIHGIWVRGHVFDICVLDGGGPVGKFMLGFIGGGGLVELGSEFIEGLGLFHPVAALVSGLVWTM